MGKIISAVDCDLIVTLPLTISTKAQTLNIKKFTAEGTAIKYGFVDTNRMNEKISVDGSAVGFKNKNTLKYVEFTVVPFSDVDNTLKQFVIADGLDSMIVLFKDNNSGIKISTDNAYIKEAPDVEVSADPDYRTYRFILLDSLVEAI